MKKLVCILVLAMMVGGCATYSSMGGNFIRLNNNAQYKILVENEDGFKLSLVYSSWQFVPSPERLVVLAKSTFDTLAKDICRQKNKNFGGFDDTEFLVSTDRNILIGHTYVRLDNWVKYQ